MWGEGKTKKKKKVRFDIVFAFVRFYLNFPNVTTDGDDIFRSLSYSYFFLDFF